jgi:hypothetical protein
MATRAKQPNCCSDWCAPEEHNSRNNQHGNVRLKSIESKNAKGSRQKRAGTRCLKEQMRPFVFDLPQTFSFPSSAPKAQERRTSGLW